MGFFSLKPANISPIHKNYSKPLGKNYRPVQIFENYMGDLFKQMSEYFEPYFSKFHCSFRKGFSSVFWQWLKSGNRQLIIQINRVNLYESFQSVWSSFTWPLNCKIESYEFIIDSFIIGVRLFVKSQKNNQNKFSIQLMWRNFIRSQPGSCYFQIAKCFKNANLQWLIRN